MIDFKKKDKELYQSKTIPTIIDVPEMTFIAIDGKGDPNTNPEYVTAVEILYSLSYSIKMNNKAILEYVVAPLEGLWSVADDFKGSGAAITDKSMNGLCLFDSQILLLQIFLKSPKLCSQRKSPH